MNTETALGKPFETSFPRTASLPMIAVSRPIRTYPELVGCVGDALDEQHTDWVGPLCDFYAARLTTLRDLFASESESAKVPTSSDVIRAA